MFSIVAIFNIPGAQRLPIKDNTNAQKYNVHLTVVWTLMRNESVIVSL